MVLAGRSLESSFGRWFHGWIAIRGARSARKSSEQVRISFLAATKRQAELIRVCFHFIDFGIAADTLEKFEKSERGGNCFH